MLMGWVKLHRETLEKAIWKCTTHEQKSIFITMLILANHKETQWIWKGKKFKCLPGQFITSLKSIAHHAQVSEQNVRTALVKFKKLEFLTDESTETGRLITICNWNTYQQSESNTNKQSNKDLTDDQQTPNKDLTPNKKEEKDKNEIIKEFNIFWDAYHRYTNKLKEDKEPSIKYWMKLTKGERARALAMIPAYAKTQEDSKYLKKARTYLADKNFEDELITNPGDEFNDYLGKLEELHKQRQEDGNN